MVQSRTISLLAKRIKAEYAEQFSLWRKGTAF